MLCVLLCANGLQHIILYLSVSAEKLGVFSLPKTPFFRRLNKDLINKPVSQPVEL